MIPKGLNVGDTFAYCDGYTYKVTAVIGDQYRVRKVGVSTPTLPTNKGKEETTDYQTMPYFELKKLCAERGLNPNGKKDELISRLSS